MVEIVGKNQAQYHTTTCRKCASDLRYVLAEVQEQGYRDISGVYDTDRFIICPCCSNRVTVRGY